ncbi:proline-rich protein 12 [Lates japonicus]|uniref:Proline-rich protein 12 n=1 Tax=Lates japonicus TaxID=270547 RepID=A0AAD3QYL4_LATJO|nr:proline-rich protein 12 [Lates japonicus]
MEAAALPLPESSPSPSIRFYQSPGLHSPAAARPAQSPEAQGPPNVVLHPLLLYTSPQVSPDTSAEPVPSLITAESQNRDQHAGSLSPKMREDDEDFLIITCFMPRARLPILPSILTPSATTTAPPTGQGQGKQGVAPANMNKISGATSSVIRAT